ncbi:CidA/LrgA family protein [Flavobacterium sp. W21_SRS_FM6]|uniref:CidA/LrgA family protein n=1 Tax=Flavobacterium sp. W21_SRS_FM6 TaxID=3240268 RepID=UPI003F926823
MAHTFYLSLAFVALICSWLIGNFLSPYVNLPPSLMGLFVMLAALLILKRVPSSLFIVSAWVLRWIALLFIPVTVGAAAFIGELGPWLGLLLFAVLLSTVVSLLLTAWLAQKLLLNSSGDSADG